jgi:hypothetical protein
MHASVIGSSLIALLAGTAGCASVGPAQQNTVRRLLHSEQFVQERVAQSLSLKRPVSRPTTDWLSARVDQIMVCRSAYRDKVATTTITSYPTKNMVIETILGLGAAAGGGVALTASPGASDVKPGPSESSPRETARVWGALGVGTGAVLLGHVVWVAVRASDEESDPVVSEEVRASTRAGQNCGTEPAGAGAVWARVDGRQVKLGDFSSGIVELNLRSRPEELCGDPHSGEKSAALAFVLNSGDHFKMALGEYELKHCVAATTARRKLRLAEAQLGGEVGGTRVAQAVRLVKDADALVESLPPSDPDVGELRVEAVRLRDLALTRARAVSQSLVKAAVAKVDANAEDAVALSLEAINVSILGNTRDEARGPIYAAFGRQRGLRAYSQLARLADADGPALACLQEGSGCAPALTQEKWLDLLGPLMQSATEIVAKQAVNLETATKGLNKTLNARTLAAFDESVAQAEASAPACRLAMGAVQAACMRLTAAEAGARAFADASDARLRTLRQHLADKQHAEDLQKTTLRWRRHFAECSHLQQGVRALESISYCDGACKAVVSKMRAQHEKLRSFEYSEIVEDPGALQRLVDECNAAGCETCP